ncbi:MAG: glutathione S-transferase family protein [Pseudomonadota bacterium]|jgi:glutathione S-transferase|nr:glutathione S-transferase N-terminal domain-containing protein [Alphaproteobacteria bacterium]
MILYSFPSSPFGCKVKAVILACEEKDITTEHFHPWLEDPSFRALNPLGKIPALKIDEKEAIFDSPVICEYIMEKAGKITTLMPNRLKSLKVQALVDGMADAAVSMRYEHFFRPKKLQCEDWYNRQYNALTSGLSYLEFHFDDYLSSGVFFENLCAFTFLSYLDLRFVDTPFHKKNKKLYRWYLEFMQRHPFLEPSLAKDHPIPDNITRLQK